MLIDASRIYTFLCVVIAIGVLSAPLALAQQPGSPNASLETSFPTLGAAADAANVTGSNLTTPVLAQQPPPSNASLDTTFPNFTAAIDAANVTGSNLTTLFAAVSASGVASSLNSSTAWTIFAPTNEAFSTRLKEDLKMTPATLLQPANRATLLKVLSYHVIPSAALNSSTLVNGQNLTTALAGAAPLTVRLQAGKKPRIMGATNSASVIQPDVQVGLSVVHIVNDVLLPKGVGKGTGKKGSL